MRLKRSSMNLTTDAWIPIVWKDGKVGIVSLRKAFERGEKIRDLAVRPHERIALMRLLICIAQAALDGPEDYEDWKACRERLVRSVLAYLDRWQHVFELFGSSQRFLQVANLKQHGGKTNEDDSDGGNFTSKLDLSSATGHNTTLFDNAGGSERTCTPAELALMLTTFQCFSPGGRIGVALWHGQKTAGNGSSDHAPCLSGGMLHALLQGDDLAATLCKNLTTKQRVAEFFGRNSWGKPVWEQMPEGLGDEKAVQNAVHTYLGRLVPLSRAIWLASDCRALILANGLEYGSYAESGWREPSATVVTRFVKGQATRVVLPASIVTAPWRELHALTAQALNKGPGGPFALENINLDEPAFDLWVGGLVVNKAKPVDSIGYLLHIPVEMLSKTSQKVYEVGVKLANSMEIKMMHAIGVYHKELGDNLDRPERKVRGKQIRSEVAAQFWTEVEDAVANLLEIATAPESFGPKSGWLKTAWGIAVLRAAREVYELTCPHETPRQLRAYALGLKTFLTAPVEAGGGESETEIEVEA
jgi:CRISPR system Cascade subunit CasA